ncbi:MAG: alkaline phosphatase D family protein [Cytophagales bacterium]|nr:alkaline phosphatase D family protein [Cytophagales bacterium]
MKTGFTYILLLLIVLVGCSFPEKRKTPKFHEQVAPLYDSALRPFYHGVASGDPLPDRVILWTRVTPEDSVSSILVQWEIASDPDFDSIYKSDTLRTDPARDYTVKVDVDALRPGTIYYYRFMALGKTSITGRTKTAAVDSMDSLQFAVVSCANWEFGYFNAYDKIADRPVLDAVLHLGDYIYEYGSGTYGDTTIGRKHLPLYEIITLPDYRTRYSQYRLDRGLRRVHQQHPFIAVWDDHEIANNSHSTGAQNHQPEKEGGYEARKAAARQAYYEWMPIRPNRELYRSFSFGPLADIIMLDERLAGRSPEAKGIDDPELTSPNRSMLGKEQLQWLKNNLQRSRATWKVIGNQVIFSDVYLKAALPNMPRNMDAWDGFPAEKKNIVDFITSNKIQDILITAGDTHASWAIEAAVDVGKSYKPFAVELGTTSISSANGDERKSSDTVKLAEQALLRENPHIKYINNRDHGYLLLTLFPSQARADWFYVKSLRQPVSEEFLSKTFTVEKGKARLK